jgi:hypothetical protein
MPCCAFAAIIVAQLLVGVRAVKRALFGGADQGLEMRNPAVEWRLGPSGAMPLAVARRSSGRLWGRRSLRGFALAAALELMIAVGAIYGLATHLGHHSGHSGHAERPEGLATRGTTDAAPPSGANVPVARD